jgi:hypothetical protein
MIRSYPLAEGNQDMPGVAIALLGVLVIHKPNGIAAPAGILQTLERRARPLLEGLRSGLRGEEHFEFAI